MNEEVLSLNDIKKRAVNAFLTLGVRQVLLRVLSFITINIILLPVLTPTQLGLFDLAGTIITFFAYFSDIGLAGSLIQKKEVTREDIITTFSIQEILVAIISLLIFGLAPLFANIYHFDNDAVWLVRILGIGFFLTSFKVIPSVMQERVLNFKPLVMVELIETLIFNGLLILLVYNQFGIWAFSIASLVRSLSGVLLIYILAPVKIGLGIHKASARKLLTFGIPFQTNTFLALLKDRLVPLLVANIVGLNGFGLISWAESMALVPLDFIGSINRIIFPVFSRLQENKNALSKALEGSLFVTALVVFPLIFGLMAIMPSFVYYVATKQWYPALPVFYLFALGTFWAAISTIFTNALNSIGQVKTTMKLMIMWTVLTWILSPLLALKYGIYGPALASFLINFTSIATIILIKRQIEVNLWRSLWLPTLSSILMAILVFVFSQLFVRDKLMLFVAVVFGGIAYFVILWMLGRKRLMSDLRSIRSV